MLLFITFLMINFITKKVCGAMVKDLNPQSDGESFNSSHLQHK